ncbi:MAG: glutathione S-transferase family protein [Rhodomicrobium sp.]
MPMTLYAMSGSPYARRVWLALEYKGLPYELKALSFDAGDFEKPEFRALTPRRRVPVMADDGFVLYESAAIVEYLEDKSPQEPHLFSTDIHQRALQRRMVREADQYFSAGLEHLVEAVLFTPKERISLERIETACAEIRKESAFWEAAIIDDYLAGALSAVDLTLYPQIALIRRIAQRNPDIVSFELPEPKMAAWMARMDALPIVRRTWPPHWKS